MKKTFTTHEMAICAMIAAIYVTACLVLSFSSYGSVQVRVAEALTLLPVFSPLAIWGVTLGCALANLIGFMTGANILGFFDVFFGTAATLIAAILTYYFRNIRFKGQIPILSAIPPVIMNALVIGLELTYMETNSLNLKVFILNACNVGIGQIISCFAIGLPLMYMLDKTGVALKIFGRRV